MSRPPIGRFRLFMLGVTAAALLLPRSWRSLGTYAVVAGAAAFAAERMDLMGFLFGATVLVLIGAAIVRGHRVQKSEPGAAVSFVYLGGVLSAPVVAWGAVWLATAAAALLTIAAAVAVVALLVAALVWGFLRAPEKTPAKRGVASHYNADGREKVSFPTLAAAQDAAKRYEEDRGDVMNAYKCGQCPGYHYGHARSR